jgi:rare lipoprotein A (peptidoglycan hydrolase)
LVRGALLAVFFSGCAGGEQERIERESAEEIAAPVLEVGAPVEVTGPSPAELAEALGVDEDALRGEASWYGEPFHGRTTANGETYDMRAFTAAHKTLPFGVVVRVTRVDTRQSVIVRINDRGPYVDGRVIDLSRAAAEEIDMLGPGHVPVLIDILEAP